MWLLYYYLVTKRCTTSANNFKLTCYTKKHVLQTLNQNVTA